MPTEEKSDADEYTPRIRALAKRNGRLHAQIWALNDTASAAQLRREIEQNTRLMREAEYLLREQRRQQRLANPAPHHHHHDNDPTEEEQEQEQEEEEESDCC